MAKTTAPQEHSKPLQTRRTRRLLLALLRVGMGWTFLWAFIDKLFGLGFATCADKGVLCEKAWLAGGSPTAGFLSHSGGIAGSFFQALAQNSAAVFVIDWLFMLGLLGIGVALITGAGVKIASYSGALMLLFMYLAVPLTNNPFLDDHIIYAILLILLAWVHAGHYYGLGKWWSEHEFVKKHKWLD